MAQNTIDRPPTSDDCTPAQRLTRSLLGYGILAGPFYVAVSLAQALTKDGFDLSRHPWSLLAVGPHGWIQVANFVLTGLMVVAAAVGVRRALGAGAGASWAPRLLAAYGVALVGAGVFRADAAAGFPAGTPADAAEVSWHGMLHFVAGGIGFTCLAVACFAIARRYAAEGRTGFARWSRASGAIFLAGFAMVASSGGSRVGTLAFVAAVLAVHAWLSAVALDLYRR